jgi:hypothetical protein
MQGSGLSHRAGKTAKMPGNSGTFFAGHHGTLIKSKSFAHQ